jgi:hypothetical protein
MKKILLVIFTGFIMINCQSDDYSSDGNSSITSTIVVDGAAFVPNELKQDIPTLILEGGLIFTLKKSDTNQAIVVNIEYPLSSTTAPNGIYDFGIGETGTMLFANGGYFTSNSMYSLAGNTVKVTKLDGNDVYKLEFQNVQAVEINSGKVIVISGSCEGKFKS